MSERKLRRVDSDEVQGEGSFVEFRGLPYALYRDWMVRIEGAPVDAQGNAQVRFAENDTLLSDVLTRTVAKWNWVDEDGQPLKTPSEGLKLDELTTDEVRWLSDHATSRGTAEAKN